MLTSAPRNVRVEAMMIFTAGSIAISFGMRCNAIHHRHLDVEHDDVDALAGKRVEGHLAVADRCHDHAVRGRLPTRAKAVLG